MSGNHNSGLKPLPAKLMPDVVSSARVTSLVQCRVEGESLLTQRGKKFFKKTCRQMIEMDRLTEADLPLVFAYAQQYDIYQDALRDYKAKGMYERVTDRYNNVKILTNPAVMVMNSALSQLKTYSVLLGIPPRDRLKYGKKSKSDPSSIINILMDAADEPEDQ